LTDLAALTPLAIAWIVLTIGLAGLVHGALGLGFPIIATPLIAAVTDVKTAVVLVAPPTIAVVIVTVWRLGGFGTALRDFWQMPIWAFVGSLVGTRVFIAIDPAPLTLVLAIGILVYLVMDRFGRGESKQVQAHRRKFGAVFGLIGGFFEGAVNIAAPPLLVYFLALGLAPVALMQALNVCFGVGKVTQVATLLATWNVPWATWAATLPLCVVAVAVLAFGSRVRERVDAATYRGWLKIALGAMAVVLLVQYALRTGGTP